MAAGQIVVLEGIIFDINIDNHGFVNVTICSEEDDDRESYSIELDNNLQPVFNNQSTIDQYYD